MKDYEKIIQDPGFDLKKVREDFPYLKHYPNLVYLDNAATSQRPRQVLDAVNSFYEKFNANPLRGNHKLSLYATESYENAREKVREFLGARKKEEIIFTRNASESLNVLARSLSERLEEGDEVLITRMEHHSNSVTWQNICKEKNAKLVYADITDDYLLDLEDVKKKLTSKTKIFAFTGASNVLSTMPSIKTLVEMARQVGALSIVDGAQLVAHSKVDVIDLDCDFLVFSGHKMLAPFGIGVLYGKEALLNEIPPALFGGEMIEYVYDDYSTYAPLPYKFEAGTQNAGGAVGLHAAIDYMEAIGLDKISLYERALAKYTLERLKEEKDIEIYHTKEDGGAAIAFNIQNGHPHDVSTIMDFSNIAIRSGHHCCQQLHRSLGLTASCRASFSFYNTKEEADQFISALAKVRQTLGL